MNSQKSKMLIVSKNVLFITIKIGLIYVFLEEIILFEIESHPF